MLCSIGFRGPSKLMYKFYSGFLWPVGERPVAVLWLQYVTASQVSRTWYRKWCARLCVSCVPWQLRSIVQARFSIYLLVVVRGGVVELDWSCRSRVAFNRIHSTMHAYVPHRTISPVSRMYYDNKCSVARIRMMFIERRLLTSWSWCY